MCRREGHSRTVADGVPHNVGVLRLQHHVLRALRLRTPPVVGARQLPAAVSPSRRPVAAAAVQRQNSASDVAVDRRHRPPVQLAGERLREAGVVRAGLLRRRLAAPEGRPIDNGRAPRRRRRRRDQPPDAVERRRRRQRRDGPEVERQVDVELKIAARRRGAVGGGGASHRPRPRPPAARPPRSELVQTALEAVAVETTRNDDDDDDDDDVDVDADADDDATGSVADVTG